MGSVPSVPRFPRFLNLISHRALPNPQRGSPAPSFPEGWFAQLPNRFPGLAELIQNHLVLVSQPNALFFQAVETSLQLFTFGAHGPDGKAM